MGRSNRPATKKQRREAKQREEDNLVEFARKPARSSRKALATLTDVQQRYDDAIFSHSLTFGIGPAGTGKTWWAAARAADELRDHRIEQLIITRPAVEAGEKLGFLPGELEEKYEPWLRPVVDALEDRLGKGAVEYLFKAGRIEARPLGMLRGSTFKNCWVIGDEMQNTTVKQMKMFLTRIGENCRMVVNGDPAQVDIRERSGLMDAVRRLSDVRDVAVVKFYRDDIVRSGLCREIIDRYETGTEQDDAEGLHRMLGQPARPEA